MVTDYVICVKMMDLSERSVCWIGCGVLVKSKFGNWYCRIIDV